MNVAEQIQSSTYDVVAAMLTEAPPVKKRNQSFVPETLLLDLGADSLEVLEVSMNLEEHFDIFIPDEQINAFKCVKDISDYIDSVLKQAITTQSPASDPRA